MTSPETNTVFTNIPVTRHRRRHRRRRRQPKTEIVAEETGGNNAMRDANNPFDILGLTSDSSENTTGPKLRVKKNATHIVESTSSCKTERPDNLWLPLSDPGSDIEPNGLRRRLRRRQKYRSDEGRAGGDIAIPLSGRNDDALAEQDKQAGNTDSMTSSGQNLDVKHEPSSISSFKPVSMLSKEKFYGADITKCRRPTVTFASPLHAPVSSHHANYAHQPGNPPDSSLSTLLRKIDQSVPLAYAPTSEQLYGQPTPEHASGWPAITYEKPAPTTHDRRSRFFPASAQRGQSDLEPTLSYSNSKMVISNSPLACHTTSPASRFLERFHFTAPSFRSSPKNSLSDDIQSDSDPFLNDSHHPSSARLYNEGLAQGNLPLPSSFARSYRCQDLQAASGGIAARHHFRRATTERHSHNDKSLVCSAGMIKEDCRIAKANFASNVVVQDKGQSAEDTSLAYSESGLPSGSGANRLFTGSDQTMPSDTSSGGSADCLSIPPPKDKPFQDPRVVLPHDSAEEEACFLLMSTSYASSPEEECVNSQEIHTTPRGENSLLPAEVQIGSSSDGVPAAAVNRVQSLNHGISCRNYHFARTPPETRPYSYSGHYQSPEEHWQSAVLNAHSSEPRQPTSASPFHDSQEIASVRHSRSCPGCESEATLRSAAKRYLSDTQADEMEEIKGDSGVRGWSALGGDGHATRQASVATPAADVRQEAHGNKAAEDKVIGFHERNGNGDEEKKQARIAQDESPAAMAVTAADAPVAKLPDDIDEGSESEWVLAVPGAVVLDTWFWDWTLVEARA